MKPYLTRNRSAARTLHETVWGGDMWGRGVMRDDFNESNEPTRGTNWRRTALKASILLVLYSIIVIPL